MHRFSSGHLNGSKAGQLPGGENTLSRQILLKWYKHPYGWTSDNHSELTRKSDTEQNYQFLQSFSSSTFTKFLTVFRRSNVYI